MRDQAQVWRFYLPSKARGYNAADFSTSGFTDNFITEKLNSYENIWPNSHSNPESQICSRYMLATEATKEI